MNVDVDAVVNYRLERAWESLAEARILREGEHWNATVNRPYNACFYAVSALLLRGGFSSSKHSGIRALFSQHFVKTARFPVEMAELYNTLYDFRQECDYEDMIRIDPIRVAPWFDDVESFIKTVVTILKESPTTGF